MILYAINVIEWTKITLWFMNIDMFLGLETYLELASSISATPWDGRVGLGKFIQSET